MQVFYYVHQRNRVQFAARNFSEKMSENELIFGHFGTI